MAQMLKLLNHRNEVGLQLLCSENEKIRLFIFAGDQVVISDESKPYDSDTEKVRILSIFDGYLEFVVTPEIIQKLNACENSYDCLEIEDDAIIIKIDSRDLYI